LLIVFGDPTFGGHYIATIKAATSLVSLNSTRKDYFGTLCEQTVHVDDALY